MFLRFQRHLGSLLRIDCGRWAIPEPEGEIDQLKMIKFIIV